jgi:dUTPase
MSACWYRLELLPTADGRVYYNTVAERSAENAGFDLFVTQNYDAASMVTGAAPTLLDLGTSARMVRVWPDGREEDVHYWLCPRSSIIKTGMMMANSQGVIDSSYRGTLKAPVWVVAPVLFNAMFKDGGFQGSRYFQIVAPDMGWIKQVVVVDTLSDTQRGAGGFGSTGVTGAT